MYVLFIINIFGVPLSVNVFVLFNTICVMFSWFLYWIINVMFSGLVLFVVSVIVEFSDM